MMLVTGVCNTILNKYQMFVGEMGCWLVVLGSYLYTRYISSRSSSTAPLLAGGYRPVRNDDVDNDEEEDRTLTEPEDPAAKPLVATDEGRTKLQGWKILLLAAPACCDITGVGLVGLAGAFFGDKGGELVHNPEDGIKAVSQLVRDVHTTARTPEAVRAIIGVLLIAAAQIFTAFQFVLEEWILEHYAMAPLSVVGWEGVFGFSVTIIAMIILHLTIGRTEAGKYGYFDAKEGWRQITTNRAIAVSSILIMISIGGFNFFGLSVTRSVSATSRSTIDTCRTLFIWLVSLGLGWETFKWLQVVGFALLVYGTFLFNDIVRPPLKACLPKEREELLPEEPIEHL
ncbi:hypothetical protein T310_0502 [Rasamsonia emersonii CBS 393.64]|uniref:Integral membrane protein n=1 Tax=Rasamsonia emersonii (strain ATCC 16479 / CBS 393.64 / IMI 116815) TaxID=1408163 RepID=A0A0F4Z6H2_RASE3|nr:hypothetical protein T310_0502 [Rasamsonia emersonii CBS 393.64]KKA25478.1 hypothetical protein T310_0502 [Rasamsonia emersonii CBS 393.64]